MQGEVGATIRQANVKGGKRRNFVENEKLSYKLEKDYWDKREQTLNKTKKQTKKKCYSKDNRFLDLLTILTFIHSWLYLKSFFSFSGDFGGFP